MRSFDAVRARRARRPRVHRESAGQSGGGPQCRHPAQPCRAGRCFRRWGGAPTATSTPAQRATSWTTLAAHSSIEHGINSCSKVLSPPAVHRDDSDRRSADNSTLRPKPQAQAMRLGSAARRSGSERIRKSSTKRASKSHASSTAMCSLIGYTAGPAREPPRPRPSYWSRDIRQGVGEAKPIAALRQAGPQ